MSTDASKIRYTYYNQPMRADSLLGRAWALWSSVSVPVAVFLAYFLSAKLGQYIYYSAHTSPALIWPPVGIALAAVLLGGYRLWIPIACGAFLAALTNGAPIANIIGTTIGSTAQPVFGAYIMRQIGFNNFIGKVNDILGLILGAIFVTMIAPSIMLLAQVFGGTLTNSALLVWGRSWAGGMLSVLIFTPLITTWLGSVWHSLPKRRVAEIAIVFAALIGIDYLLFWTPFTSFYGISLIYAFIIPFFWIGLRLGARSMTAALFISSIVTIAGTLVRDADIPTIGNSLFQDQFFLMIIAGISLILLLVVEERRASSYALRDNVHELEHALEKIRGEDRAKSEFIAILAHELRNPLSPIMSNLELFKLQTSDADAHEAIDDMEKNVRSMKRLLDDLLDIARITQQKFKLQKDTIDLELAVQRAVASAQEMIKSKDHRLLIQLPSQSVTIHVDPVRFEQIAVNVLNNAVKYTPAGGEIRLAAIVHDESLILTIADTGIGIAPERAREIFEPFKQLKPGQSTGLGIGLSVTKRLVEMHGGTIKVASTGPGQGSTFTIQFPRVIAHSMPKTIEQPVSTEKTSGFDVLLVDDNEAAARGLSKLLQYKGHRVVVAHSGADALAVLETDSTRTIGILDIGLPDIDGFELAMRIRAKTPAMTLIAVTGFGQEEDKQKAKEAGFDYHLTKPIGIADLEAIFKEIISNKE